MNSVELQHGYRQMAEDKEHETLALEWCEALVSDALLDEGDRQSTEVD